MCEFGFARFLKWMIVRSGSMVTDIVAFGDL